MISARMYNNFDSYWMFGVRFTSNELFHSKWEVHIELGPLATVVIWKGMDDE